MTPILSHEREINQRPNTLQSALDIMIRRTVQISQCGRQYGWNTTGRDCGSLFPAIVWFRDRAFSVRGIQGKEKFLSKHHRTPVVVCAFSGILPPTPLYVWISQGRCCARGPACVGLRGLLDPVQWIHCFLFSRSTAESILQCRPLLPAHASRLSPYIACSHGSHISTADPHRAPHTEPHTLGMTYCLFLPRLHAQHDPRSRPTKWENKGVFCRPHNPLPFLLGQLAVMVPGQDWRQPEGYRHLSAARLCWHWLIHQWTLGVLEAMPEARLASWQGWFLSAKGYCRSSYILVRLSYVLRNW